MSPIDAVDGSHDSEELHMQTITTIGLDIAKSVFQVHGVDAAGQVVIRRQLKRRYVLAFFQKLSPCLVGIEACASSHRFLLDWSNAWLSSTWPIGVYPLPLVVKIALRPAISALQGSQRCFSTSGAQPGASPTSMATGGADALETLLRDTIPNATLSTKARRLA